MNILQNLRYEFIAIMSILILGFMFGFEECKKYWDYDIGKCIGIIGILWTIGSFFKFYSNISFNIASLITGISIFILGYSIHACGIFTGFIFLGLVLIYFSYMGHSLYPKTSTIIFLASIPIILLGYILKPCDSPSGSQYYYQPLNNSTSINWNAFVYYISNQGITGTNISEITGTEENAYRQTRNLVTQWKKDNPSRKIVEIQVRIEDCLYDHAKDYSGYVPTHSLFKKFPKDKVPEYCNLTDLEN